jgi:squalene-hopene/tetraprenyl-beta-curcumene cyclase
MTKSSIIFSKGVLAICLCGALFSASSISETKVTNSWNPKGAAAYLDKREGWWMTWQGATRDRETFCVSCHTAVPYALSRPRLRLALAEQAPTSVERSLLENITRRVRLWKSIKPFYGDQEKGSRGTEAVLNALILASLDASNGRLGNDTRAAFDNMWELQETTGAEKGAWPWLNFRNEPWEASDSPYFGASMAAIAAGTAPENYRATQDLRDRLKLLRQYLARERSKQSLINQVDLLWASAKLPGIISPEQQSSIIKDVLREQQPDGGWSLSSLAWSWRGTSAYSLIKLWARSEASPFEAKSDGYATGLITFVLQQGFLPPQNVNLQRGLAWLVRSQDRTDGQWQAYSLNTRHAPSSYTGLFMSDAATAYAVLALTSTN